MPSYEYSCGSCGAFETARSMSEAAAPYPCPECGELAPRALAVPHVRTSWAGLRYIAESRNEKSAHEPMTEHRLRGAGGHGHAHGAAATSAHRHAHVHRSRRPWMIGH